MINTPYRTYRGDTSLTNRVFEAIRDNPGISNKELYTLFKEEFSPSSVMRAVENLRINRHQVVNRGTGQKSGSRRTAWYVVEIEDESIEPYYKLADDILNSMKGLRFGEKRGYLADRLQEILEEKK